MEVSRTEENKGNEENMEWWWWVSVILNRVPREGPTEKEVRVPARQKQDRLRGERCWSRVRQKGEAGDGVTETARGCADFKVWQKVPHATLMEVRTLGKSAEMFL